VDEPGRQPTPAFELALGVLGGLVVLSLVGWLVWWAYQGAGRGHPDIRVEVLAPLQLTESWMVPFRVHNEGEAPAAGLQLEALLDLPSGAVERSRVVIDYLARASTAEGGFYFSRDPRQGTLSARPLGYAKP
jgi:uncharacterized protein (TIGR02588 family)